MEIGVWRGARRREGVDQVVEIKRMDEWILVVKFNDVDDGIMMVNAISTYAQLGWQVSG